MSASTFLVTNRFETLRDRRLLALIPLVVFAVFPGLAYGIFRSYLQYPDADISFPYWALLLNAEMPLNWYDHPGFFYNLLLAKWFTALKALGFVPIDSFLELPDRDSFEGVYAQLVYAARALALIQAGCLAVIVFFGMRLLVDRFDLAVGATVLALALPPVALLMLIVRSELLSAIAMYGAFFAIIAAGRARSEARQGWLFALAGFAGFIAVETKVIAAVPLCGAFLIASLFMSPELGRPRPLDRATKWLVVLTGLAVVVPFVGDCVRLWTGVRLYHFAIIGAVIVPLAALVWRRQGSMRDMVVALAWLLGGVGAAYLINATHYESGNIKAVLYIVDHSLIQVDALGPAMRTGGVGSALWPSFIRHVRITTTDIWLVAIYAAALIVLIATVQRRDWLLAAKIVLLVGLDLATATIFGLRGSDQYAIFYYFWTVIALAIGAEPILLAGSRALSTVAAIGVLVVAGGMQVHNLQPAWQPVPLEQACVQANIYVHRLRDYWNHYCSGDLGSASGR